MKPALLLISPPAQQDDQIVPVLEAAGWLIHGPSQGVGALELAREHQPAVILIQTGSARVPHGLTLCEHLRADRRTSAIPILIVSSLGAMADRLDGFRAGADAYLPTPCAYEELVVRLKALLPSRGEGRAMPYPTPWEGSTLGAVRG